MLREPVRICEHEELFTMTSTELATTSSTPAILNQSMNENCTTLQMTLYKKMEQLKRDSSGPEKKKNVVIPHLK